MGNSHFMAIYTGRRLPPLLAVVAPMVAIADDDAEDDGLDEPGVAVHGCCMFYLGYSLAFVYLYFLFPFWLFYV